MLSTATLPQGALLIEIRGVYDGWSISVSPDGTLRNRWANDEGTGPEPGYERRYSETEAYIDGMDGIHPEYQQ